MTESIEARVRNYRKQEKIGRFLGSICLGVAIGAIAYGAAQHDRGMDSIGGGILVGGVYLSMLSNSTGRSADTLDAEVLTRERINISPTDVPQIAPSSENQR